MHSCEIPNSRKKALNVKSNVCGFSSVDAKSAGGRVFSRGSARAAQSHASPLSSRRSPRGQRGSAAYSPGRCTASSPWFCLLGLRWRRMTRRASLCATLASRAHCTAISWHVAAIHLTDAWDTRLACRVAAAAKRSTRDRRLRPEPPHRSTRRGPDMQRMRWAPHPPEQRLAHAAQKQMLPDMIPDPATAGALPPPPELLESPRGEASDFADLNPFVVIHIKNTLSRLSSSFLLWTGWSES